MDPAASPSPPSCNSSARNSHASQDFGKPARKSQYRLFPIVDPTPPASPVTLQKFTLSKSAAGASRDRRRSSSLDNNGKKDPNSAIATNASTATLPSTTFSAVNYARKASCPEIRPLRTVRELDNNVASPDLIPRPHTAVDRALDDCSFNRSNSAPDDSSIRDRDRPSVALLSRDQLLQTGLSPALANSGFSLPLSPVVENDTTHATGNSRAKAKPKPNLRIAIAKEDKAEHQLPPPPPAKSPRRPRQDSHHDGHHSPKRQSRSPVSTLRSSGLTEPPITPQLALVAQQQAILPLSSGHITIRELTVSPGSVRGRSVRKHPGPMHDLLPSDFESNRSSALRPNLYPPYSKFSTSNSRPQTSDGGTVSSSRRQGSSPSPTRLKEQSAQHPRTSSRDWLRQGNDLNSHPEPIISPSNTDLTSFPAIRSPAFLYLPNAPGIGTKKSLENTIEHSINDRPATSQGTPYSERKPWTVDTHSATEEYTAYKPSAALAAARANVAALRNSNSSGSPGFYERSRSAGSDTDRGPSDLLLLRRPSSPAQADPAQTLKELGFECEGLHAKYATLRAERQKLSSDIINKLKSDKPGSDSVNSVLDEQLALAALSSSMDICFAKLKSLECRREDAISALIAKSSPTHRSPTDNISAMIASMAVPRKTSLATDSSSRFAVLSGRSTPDVGDSSSLNRLTHNSARTLSYGSEPECLDIRLSSVARKPSIGSESIRRSDSSMEKQAPETILEVAESPNPTQASHELDPSQRRPEETMQSASPPRYETDLSDRCPDSTRASSAYSEGLPEELVDDRIAKIPGNGTKAAKLLGLLEQAAEDKDATLINPAEAYEDCIGKRASLLSIHPKLAVDDAAHLMDNLASSDLLELQLKSFPKPRMSITSSQLEVDERRNTGGSVLTNGSSANSSCGEPPELPPRAPRAPRAKSNATTNTEFRKRDPSAHTIEVYNDLDNDAVLNYYDHVLRQ